MGSANMPTTTSRPKRAVCREEVLSTMASMKLSAGALSDEESEADREQGLLNMKRYYFH
jgi:hypothetical protein